jgi:hypothetical protein
MTSNQVRVVVDTAKWAAVNKVTLVRRNGAQEASDAPVFLKKIGVEPGLAGPGGMDVDAEAGKGAAAAPPPSEVGAAVVGAGDAVAAALARGAESAAAVNGASPFFFSFSSLSCWVAGLSCHLLSKCALVFFFLEYFDNHGI